MKMLDAIRADKRPIATWRKAWQWWVDYPWTTFYCRHAHFHLMRSRINGQFIIVWDRRNHEPKVHGYTIEVGCWTPRGCHRAARASVFWDRLVKEIGPEGMEQVMRGVEKEGAA